ncbi:hypothetical protein [Streptacidiphilus monticola]|uniref:Alpha/beta hydrolase n=1 Tax=Streptacidiphilus monticola TaxID=2161674 RepID=A0ABW1FVU8_9ACTN
MDEWHLGDDAVVDLMGGHAPDLPEQFAEADPAQAGEPPFPVTLIHGDEDEDVPLRLSRAYATAHPTTRLLELPAASHMDLISPTVPAPWAALLSALS